MKVERRRHEPTDDDAGFETWEYVFTLNGRSYIAARGLGSGISFTSTDEDAPPEHVAEIADFLMSEDGIRFVYWGLEQVRPPRRTEPRPLRPEERELLAYLVSLDDPRFEPLRQQVPHTLVADDSQLPLRLELLVERGQAPPATEVRSQVTVEATTIRDDEWIHTATLWLDGDYLGSIDVLWYVNEPERLPLPHELDPPREPR